ncbi:MAG: GNAT family N-acetyltransferase, partial [Candidatus Hodarchaeota archaeon]
KLNLPDRLLPRNIEISTISNRSDLNRLLDIFLKIFPDEIDSEKEMNIRDFRETEFDGLFIAKLKQNIIGFLISGISGKDGYILYIGVLEEYRSQGIATNLLKNFLQYLKVKNIQIIKCNINKDNKKTLSYIKFLGFKEI